LLVLVGLAQAVGLIGSFVTRRSLGPWYRSLDKPWWTPPGRVIGAVWTVLYTLMGIAEYLAWRAEGRRRGLAFYLGQLGLNLGWSALFFGLRSPAGALGEIVLLWLAIAAWIGSLARGSRLAAALAAPYLAWTTFAAALNWAIWRRNR
jgi:tryptophan-rich sensory protein